MNSTCHRIDPNGVAFAGLTNTNFIVTATHATQATATMAAGPGARHVITDIIVGSDKDGALAQVKAGTTVILAFNMRAGAMHIPLQSPLELDVNTAATVTIDGTAACYANVVGFTLKP